jgi:pectinesterase
MQRARSVVRSVLFVSAVGLSVPWNSWAAPGIKIQLTNPLPVARVAETIALNLSEIRALAPDLNPQKMVVRDSKSSIVLTQWVDLDGDEAPDQLVFQRNFSSKQKQTLIIEAGLPVKPSRAAFKVYGRFFRERHDDFAWENDRVAHRMYGPDLEIWKTEPLTSSGIDVWCKTPGALVLNDWYMVDDYHRNHGQGGDFYSVRKTRGVGGTGIRVGERFFVSRNFTKSRVLASGPIRLVFELEYAAWDAGGIAVSETKRVTLDAGSSFNRFESIFRGNGKPLRVGVGLARHAGAEIAINRESGVLRGWEPLTDGDKKPVGHLGSAILVDPQRVLESVQTESDQWLILSANDSEPIRYFVGTAWDRGSKLPNREAWDRIIEETNRRLSSPIEVRLVGDKPPPIPSRK